MSVTKRTKDLENAEEKVNISTQEKNNNSSISGAAIVFAFSIISLYLAFNHSTFGYKTIWAIVFFVSILISLLGAIVELTSYIKEKFSSKNLDAGNFSVGLILLFAFYFIDVFLTSKVLLVLLVIDLLKIFFLLFGSAAFIDSWVKISKTVFDKNSIKINIKTTLLKSTGFLISLASFLASIVAILEAFGFI